VSVDKVEEILRKAKNDGRNFLFENEAKSICACYGIPTPKFYVAKSEDECVECAKKLGLPVVLKIISRDIIHKSDVGGVLLNLVSEEDVRSGIRKIVENLRKLKLDAAINGFLVEELVKSPVEVIVGAFRDIMFGLGGIFVELLRDVSYRLCPIQKVDAEEILTEIKFRQILEGYRNIPPVNKEAIINILIKTSRMVVENPIIAEVDLNPIAVGKDDAKVLDARIILVPNTIQKV